MYSLKNKSILQLLFWIHFLNISVKRNNDIPSWRVQLHITHSKQWMEIFISMETALGQNGQREQTNHELKLVHKLHMKLCFMNKLIQLRAVHKTIQNQKNLDYSYIMYVMDNSALRHYQTFTCSSYVTFYAGSLKIQTVYLNAMRIPQGYIINRSRNR